MKVSEYFAEIERLLQLEQVSQNDLLFQMNDTVRRKIMRELMKHTEGHENPIHVSEDINRVYYQMMG